MVPTVQKVSVLCFTLLFFISACSQNETRSALEQINNGRALYSTYCASCHEIEGGIGPIITEKVLATRVNAALLFNYNKLNMPYEAGNTLTDDEYWAITAFLLNEHGFVGDSLYITPENAPSILLATDQ